MRDKGLLDSCCMLDYKGVTVGVVTFVVRAGVWSRRLALMGKGPLGG